MSWTLLDIKNKVLKLTGRSTFDISEQDLVAIINKYYQYVLPHQLKALQLRDWYTFNTVVGQGDYIFDNTTWISYYGPSYVNGVYMRSYIDPEYFYLLYPQTAPYPQGLPSDMLVFGSHITLYPTPDQVYQVKIASYIRPTALANNTDRPIADEWGPLISYGSAIEFLEDNGDAARAQELMPSLERYKAIAADITDTTLSNYRVKGKF